LIHYQEGSYGIEDGKSATAATVPIILASKQLKNIFKKRRLFKTNLKVENFDYPSVNVTRLMELIQTEEDMCYSAVTRDHDGVGLKLTVTLSERC
jgi:hypothetical protein